MKINNKNLIYGLIAVFCMPIAALLSFLISYVIEKFGAGSTVVAGLYYFFKLWWFWLPGISIIIQTVLLKKHEIKPRILILAFAVTVITVIAPFVIHPNYLPYIQDVIYILITLVPMLELYLLYYVKSADMSALRTVITIILVAHVISYPIVFHLLFQQKIQAIEAFFCFGITVSPSVIVSAITYDIALLPLFLRPKAKQDMNASTENG